MAQDLTMKTQGVKSLGHDGWVQAFFEQGSIYTKNMTERAPCRAKSSKRRRRAAVVPSRAPMMIESSETRFADISSAAAAEEAEV